MKKLRFKIEPFDQKTVMRFLDPDGNWFSVANIVFVDKNPILNFYQTKAIFNLGDYISTLDQIYRYTIIFLQQMELTALPVSMKLEGEITANSLIEWHNLPEKLQQLVED